MAGRVATYERYHLSIRLCKRQGCELHQVIQPLKASLCIEVADDLLRKLQGADNATWFKLLKQSLPLPCPDGTRLPYITQEGLTAGHYGFLGSIRTLKG